MILYDPFPSSLDCGGAFGLRLYFKLHVLLALFINICM